MKKILLLLLFILTSFMSISQVDIKIEDNKVMFENQKEFKKDKLPIFENRLEKYYNIEIEYDQSENLFLLTFNTEIKKGELGKILSHFNVYEYKIIKL